MLLFINPDSNYPSLAIVGIIYPLKTPKNAGFFGVFRVYKMLALGRYGLRIGRFFLRVVNVMRCAIWYHLYNLKNVKSTHGGALLLAKPVTLLKRTLLHGCFSRFVDCSIGAKSRKASQIFFFITFD